MRKKSSLAVQIPREKVVLKTHEPAPRRVILGRESNGHRTGDVGTDGDHVGGIVSETEVVEEVAKCRQYAISLLPHAIKVIADTIHSEDPRLRLSAAFELCKIANVSQSGGMDGTSPAADQNAEKKRLVCLGQMLDMMMNKSERYEMPLPPGFAKQAREIADRAENLTRKLGAEADSKE